MKHVERAAVCLLAIFLVVLLTACGGKDVDMEGLAADLTASSAFTMDMNQYKMDAALAAPTYGFAAEDVTSSLFFFNNATAEEIFLAQAKDDDAAQALAGLCQTRVQNQQTSLQSYVPEAIPRLQNAVIEQVGEYVIFVVANDGAAARSIVDGYIK